MVVVRIDGMFIMPKEEAFKMVEFLETAEIFEEKYVAGGPPTYHVYPSTNASTMRVVPQSLYEMAKLAGKPEKS